MPFKNHHKEKHRVDEHQVKSFTGDSVVIEQVQRVRSQSLKGLKSSRLQDDPLISLPSLKSSHLPRKMDKTGAKVERIKAGVHPFQPPISASNLGALVDQQVLEGLRGNENVREEDLRDGRQVGAEENSVRLVGLNQEETEEVGAQIGRPKVGAPLNVYRQTRQLPLKTEVPSPGKLLNGKRFLLF